MPDQTMRQILEAIRDEHHQEYHGLCYAGCVGSWPCIAHLEAEAGLSLLNDAEDDIFDDEGVMCALIPDPDAWELANGIGPWVKKGSVTPEATP